jgi:MFS transporter, PAT family, beta-lactamase induction signal transducer AmpG
MTQLGYRAGMLVAGAGAFYIATPLGWQITYFIMAAIVGVGILTTLLSPEPEASRGIKTEESFAFSQWVRASVIEPFVDFTRHESWWLILIFVIVYKLADAFMGGMTNPFYLDIGFSKIAIANIVKVFGVAPTLIGIFLGGALTVRYGAIRILFVVGFMHALTNLLFVVQAHVGASSTLLAVSIAAENLSGGISSAAFVAYLSNLTNVHYTGTQYALLSSLAAFGTTWLSTPAGYLVKYVGWAWFFAFAASLALPGLALLYILEKRLTATSPQGGAT